MGYNAKSIRLDQIMDGLDSQTKMLGYQLACRLGMMTVLIEKSRKTHKSTIRLLSHVPTVLGLPEGGAFSILYRAASVHLARKASQVMLVGWAYLLMLSTTAYQEETLRVSST